MEVRELSRACPRQCQELSYRASVDASVDSHWTLHRIVDMEVYDDGLDAEHDRI